MATEWSRKRATFDEQNYCERDLITINAGHSSVINSQKQYLTAILDLFYYYF